MSPSADRVRRNVLARFVPSGLTTRLLVTMTSAALVVFVIIATVVSVILAYYTRALASTDAYNQLSLARLNIDLQARELSALGAAYTDWNQFYDQTLDPSPTFVSSEFDPWLAEHADASAVVWTRTGADVISSFGDPADVSALLGLTESHPDGIAGLVVLPSGPSVVAIRPIVGDPPRPSVGAVAVARPLDAATLSSGNADLHIDATGGGLEPPGPPWRFVRRPTGYEWAAAALVDDEWVTRAALPVADGRTALTIEVAQPDPWIGEGRLWLAVLVPVGLGILTIGVGALVALSVSRSIGRPLRQFVRYMQEQGYLAIQGLRTDDELLIDPDLPADFRELGQVIVDLMTQLRINQSELIEAGEQALTAERAFRTVVEESPEVKILVRQGVVEIANPAAAHFFGLHLGDLVRAEPEGLFTGIGLYDEGGHRMDLATLAERATRGPVVARCTVPNQPDRWIEISVAVLDPVMLDYVISARNITEERRLEALREEILSLVSHDLRSPLTVVRGYLDILARPLDDERRGAAAESAKRAADRMEGLLDDLLHATRAERVFAPTVMRLVDLGELVEAVSASLQVGAEQQIRVVAEPGIVVLGDEVRLEQAVSNLVGNAIKHGPENGEIRVTVSSQGGRARLTVEDDGPGLPEDQWETVFERGKRGPTSSGKPGLGLGLYIVRVVAEAHGGTAYIERSSTGGSRFVVELPLEQADDRSASARARTR